MDRRTLIKGGVALSLTFGGCLEGISPSSSSDALSCPSTVPRIEYADFDGEFQMKCERPAESSTDAEGTTLTPDVRSVSLPHAETTFTLTNRHDQHFNANFYNWELQKRVGSEWYGTVGRKFSAGAGSSLAPGNSHTWSVSITNDNLGQPVEPVTGNESLSLRALGGGTYAFIVVGSYGNRGQSWGENQPLIGYATPFKLQGDALQLVPTNSVHNVTRKGSTVTVTVGADDPNRTITVAKRTETQTASERPPATYITESVYGHPTLRNILAHFDKDVEKVTLRTTDLSGSSLQPGLPFSYEGTTYQVTSIE